jgi:hypothetical protein
MSTGQTREEETLEVIQQLRQMKSDLRRQLIELNEENTRLYAEVARLQRKLGELA